MFQNRKQHHYKPNIDREILCNLGYFYRINKLFLDVDYTGNVYGPMRTLLGDLDPRREYSPTWSIQNIQFTFNKFKNIEIYGGVKNILNWTPNKGNPLLLLGQTIHLIEMYNLILTASHSRQPYALTFDPLIT
jgi:outer membrane receptor for ferrienterochelin and colicins